MEAFLGLLVVFSDDWAFQEVEHKVGDSCNGHVVVRPKVENQGAENIFVGDSVRKEWVVVRVSTSSVQFLGKGCSCLLCLNFLLLLGLFLSVFHLQNINFKFTR